MKNFGIYTKISKHQNKLNTNDIMKNLLTQTLMNNPISNSFQNNAVQSKEEQTNLNTDTDMTLSSNVQTQYSTILKENLTLFPQPK